MKIGVTIPNSYGVEDPQQVVALGFLAEELGFDSIWVMDHLFNVGFVRRRLENRPYYHPMATLTYIAAVTTKITLGTSVMVLPYHNPVELAKYVATLDQFSGGRVTLGVGAGALAEEFAALGVPMNKRGVLTNESIRIMRELWTAPEPSFESPRWRFDDVLFSPKPRQQPHPPIWVGGSAPGAMKRAATLGDGWHPLGIPAQDLPAKMGEVRSMAAAAGRDPDALALTIRLNVSLGGQAGPARPGVRSDLEPNADVITEALREYEAVGVEHVCLAFDTGDVDLLATTMRMIAADVVPAFRPVPEA